ncbi:hypothetical protein BS47DRAFT_1384595 [Hydnum rufescens UP504]|uniref:DUF6532 domain-containing protein n=1 Tax=Hydnum rufescens UP504 TaxID=1448309 RepID=A0A9P6ANB5_9AGAM|nr:hypothetical protein BS47DRAFT_1384595 [Hydnum rufescens UP504]
MPKKMKLASTYVKKLLEPHGSQDDEESLSVQSSFEQPPNVPMPQSATALSGGILAKWTSDVFKSDHGNSSPEPKKSWVLIIQHNYNIEANTDSLPCMTTQVVLCPSVIPIRNMFLVTKQEYSCMETWGLIFLLGQIINEAASFHSKFKQKALNTVPYLYAFFGKDQDAIIHIRHPKKPCENALQHPAISTSINMFFELSEVKVLASDVMPTFLEMPCETIAFALTVSLQIHNVLASWKRGTLKTQNLSATNYGQFYQGHINWIQEWCKKPVWSEEWKDVSKDLGSAAMCIKNKFIMGSNFLTCMIVLPVDMHLMLQIWPHSL